MLLKIYPIYLSAVSTVNISFLFPIIVGLILGSFTFMKLIKICFDNFYTKTYYTIIGFSLGSLVILLPDLGFNVSTLVGVLLCFLCFRVIRKIET